MKLKKRKKKNKIQWSKAGSFLTMIFGFGIVQECLYLMYLCIMNGYEATAAWLTAGVGVGEAVIIAGYNGYLSLCKVDHKDGGITMEAARANNFKQQEEEPEI